MISSVFIVIVLFYLLLIGLFSFGFDRVKEFQLRDIEPKTRFTIIIPFRNEEQQLPYLLESLLNLNYPKSYFEVILVDDDSEDHSLALINKTIKTTRKPYTISVLKNKRVSNSPKKDAITTAIAKAKYDWIVTTDADCAVPKYWLDAFDDFIQTKDFHCITGLVTLTNTTTFFKRFQALDFLSLQGVTIGGFGIKRPFLSNGANMAYLKSEFESLNGFEGNNHIASGDDVFLLDKFIRKNKNKVGHLKCDKSIVTTHPERNLSNLIQQRLRWASKTSQTGNNFTKLVGLTVFITNLVCVLLIALVLFGFLNLKTAALLFILKFCIDFLLLFKVSRFFKQEELLISYVFSSCIYPFFSVYIAALSLFSSFNWKGRTFKS
ncbi:glycosyltransferase [Winogradskyella sp. DF17]|uniref:Glycosyltransferase n=1 Tax=Winogradskyella pelagia TaxID=2819984 RepID=A0ABS3SYT5_9FLAO|nr:glycosyltransferase [Winogradskyella sp. DF17]MBO3115619.1 glycosyltransferase [Winogradskyella sp. DF17]